jgi:RimJ/RimL family protein N-acetyltransferase
MPVVPEEIRTERLLLRPYRADDAERLRPVLVANVNHLRSWLPTHVWELIDLPELEDRLRGYAMAFETNVEWRYAVLSHDQHEMVGSVCLFPRDAGGRVPLAGADRAEIGYWIRRDLCGRGYATELTKALIDVARALPGVGSIEIRCNAQNAPSAAVPRRLGFDLVVPGVGDGEGNGSQLWVLER